MGWEPALPPAKCFEGACHFQVGLHRDLRLQAAGANTYVRLTVLPPEVSS